MGFIILKKPRVEDNAIVPFIIHWKSTKTNRNREPTYSEEIRSSFMCIHKMFLHFPKKLLSKRNDNAFVQWYCMVH